MNVKKLDQHILIVCSHFSSVGWYGLSRYMKAKIPEDELYYNQHFMKCCTVNAKPIEECGLPSPSILVNLGKQYAFKLSQAAWAASHLCPIEWHVQLVEYITEEIRTPLETIIKKRFLVPVTETKETPPHAHGLKEDDSSSNQQSNSSDSQAAESDERKTATSTSTLTSPSLAQLVCAVLELKIDETAQYFPSAEALKQVHYEKHLRLACEAIENESTLEKLSVEEKVKILQETIRSVIYEFLVANWEVRLQL